MLQQCWMFVLHANSRMANARYWFNSLVSTCRIVCGLPSPLCRITMKDLSAASSNLNRRLTTSNPQPRETKDL
jgi:hypothetical protein